MSQKQICIDVAIANFSAKLCVFLSCTGGNSWALVYRPVGLCAAFLCFLVHWLPLSFIYVCLLCCLTQELPIAFIVECNEGCFYHHLPAGQRWEWRQMGQLYNDEQDILNLEAHTSSSWIPAGHSFYDQRQSWKCSSRGQGVETQFKKTRTRSTRLQQQAPIDRSLLYTPLMEVVFVSDLKKFYSVV